MITYIRQAALLTTATMLLGAVTACGTVQDHRQRERNGSREDAAAKNGPSGAHGQRPFTLTATGDILSHDSVIRQAREDAGGSGYDFRRMLAGAKPVASRADLAICHMETVYGRADGPFTGYPAFKTPPDVAGAIKDTGYESCSAASNHSMDDGVEGVRRTLDAMDKAGLKHAGSATLGESADADDAHEGRRREGRATRLHLRDERHRRPEEEVVGGQPDRPEAHHRRRPRRTPCRSRHRRDEPALGNGVAGGAGRATEDAGQAVDPLPAATAARTSTSSSVRTPMCRSRTRR